MRQYYRPGQPNGPSVFILFRWIAVAFFFTPGICAQSPGEDAALGGSGIEGEEGTTTRIVIICSQFPQEDMAPIEQSILAQVADLEIDVQFHFVSDLPVQIEHRNALARALLESYRAMAVFNIRPNGDQVDFGMLLKTDTKLETSQRSVAVEGGTSLHESLGVIVRAAATTIIERKQERERVAMAPPATTPPQQMVPPASSQTESHRMDFAAGVALGFFSKGVSPWVGMDLRLGWNPIGSLYVHLGYTSFAQVKSSAYDVQLILRRHPVRLGTGYFWLLKSVSLGAGATFTVDFASENLSTGNESLSVRPNGSEIHLSLSPYLQMIAKIYGPLCFFMNISAEIPLTSTEYRVSTTDSDITVLQGMRVQPVLMSGIQINFF